MGSKLASIASLLLLGAVLAGAALLHWAIPDRGPFAVPIWACVFLAFVTPFAIITIRHQVRRNRIKLIELFSASFDLKTDCTSNGSDLASFEFVRGKYFADLDPKEKGNKDLSVSDMPRFPMMLHADWMLLFCAVPYMIFSGFGIFVLFSPLDQVSSGAMSKWLAPSILAAGGAQGDWSKAAIDAFHINVLTVTSLAYAGAYFHSLRLFLSAVATFDLSPLTFLRAFAHMVLSVTLAVVLYRAVPSSAGLENMVAEISGGTGTRAFDPTSGLGPQWFVVAFAMGFFPDFALDRLMRLVDYPFKRRYTVVEKHSPQVPLTVLDGIDLDVEYRLKEANIFDVQNLATFNPIMLHIESPYGIYQTVDWTAQAQLCTVAGPDRFLLLKTLNIRTIFDLERAVLDKSADPEILKAVGAIILHDCSRDKAMRKDIADAASVTFIAGSFGAPAVIQLTHVMLDDLHVYRLRQLWDRIKQKIDGPTNPAAAVQILAEEFTTPTVKALSLPDDAAIVPNSHDRHPAVKNGKVT